MRRCNPPERRAEPFWGHALRRLVSLLLLTPLAGCNAVLLDPAGDVAVQQRNLLLISTGLMLLIIVPVIAIALLFAWRYRASNDNATYQPDWDHSTQLELLIWSAPLVIIVCLGALTWVGTHVLDPYRPIARIRSGELVRPGTKPLRVQVVALDWKWLFIYPDLGIATVNELAAPANTPIDFQITASNVMNAFFVPALAGQIYAMPGMETQLHAVLNRPGEYQGMSSNYSGAGFSGMHFPFHGLAPADFAKWVASVKAGGGALDRGTYLRLARPSEDVAPMRFAGIDPTLYDAALNFCVAPGKTCLADMMMRDARGGGGKAGLRTDPRAFEHDGEGPRGAFFQRSPDSPRTPDSNPKPVPVGEART
jgi:cytochrome o ubiquinol oxidase subunit 2